MAHIDKTSQRNILVLGYIIRGPLGGMAWHHMQYVLGLHKMGHNVYYLEDSGDEKYCCYNPVLGLSNEDPTYGIRFIENLFGAFQLNDRWAYYDKHQDQWHGNFSQHFERFRGSFDMLLNLSGSNPIRGWLSEVPLKVFIDTDPSFTQIRNLQDARRMALAKQHDRFFTFGENFGMRDCRIPDDGFPWKPTRQPVVLDAWRVIRGPLNGKFTTVMQWDSYPPLTHNGLSFAQKSESFGKFLEVPMNTGEELEIAMGSGTAPRQKLRDLGWKIRNPMEVASDPWTYRDYIQQSKGEFSVCKHGYVISNSGWFSERSSAYLASGRPVIVQETGFSNWMQKGSGVFPFTEIEEIYEAIDAIASDYERHCRSAREIARSYFNAESVLSLLIEEAYRKLPYTANQTHHG